MGTPPEHKISCFLRSEISELFNRARVCVRSSGVRILTAPTSASCGRILIVTPRASGNAPERNLFKRRVRALFREHKLALSGKDFVVIVNKKGVGLSFAKLAHLLLRASKDENS